MRLLLDAGNTDLKWAYLTDEGSLCEFNRTPYSHLAPLLSLSIETPFDAIYGVIVAGNEKRKAIEAALNQSVLWQYSQKKSLNIINHYQNPKEHGADRWFNVIGARGVCSEGPLLVVSCGTAVTIDALDSQDHYLGGCIIPGIGLMHSMLDQKTAQLHYALGEYQPFPKNTPDALMSGIINAISGAIYKQGEQLSAHDVQQKYTIILTGGNAKLILPFLDSPIIQIDNLVLHGLARWILK